MANNKEATKKQLRNFGIALTVFLIIIGFIHFKKGNVTQYQWIWGIALANIDRRFLVIDFPSGPFYFLVPVGAFFLCLEFIVSMFYIAADIRSGEKNVNA